MLKLYDYFRSGAAYRTRIALNLKQLEYEQFSINLTKDGGEQFGLDYNEINPQNLVPTLVNGDLKIYQSMAIMEYLEEAFPEPSLFPADQVGRAHVRAVGAQVRDAAGRAGGSESGAGRQEVGISCWGRV